MGSFDSDLETGPMCDSNRYIGRKMSPDLCLSLSASGARNRLNIHCLICDQMETRFGGLDSSHELWLTESRAEPVGGGSLGP